MLSEKVRCPKCEWEPSIEDKWYCSPCGHIWNTFTTFGQCPKCGKIWKDTQCLSCAKWSPHVDWYVDLENIKLDMSVIEKMKA